MIHWTALIVFTVLFIFVTVVGFVASRWRQGDMGLLSEWGLGGRRFGTVITWFLLGGDLYTAYTFIAVPALVFASGALGFFALPYTLMVFPILFLVFPRLWSVAKKNGYITAADFVKGRYDSGGLALAMAITGVLATMPYIALQLIGMQAVLGSMGLQGSLPLIIAFVILAAYDYKSGLRAPALIAVVEDTLIYVTVIAAVIVIPARLGGFAHIFQVAGTVLPTHTPPGTLIVGPKAYTAYATLALGSALALLLYPHSITGILSSSGRNVIKRNAALLPVYSIMLGFLALLGYMALAAGIHPSSPTDAVPMLLMKEFPSWFVGFAFAAIAIGALVPAAIMSIAASNLFTRNIYREYIRPDCTDQDQARVAKITSLVVKFGALAFVLWLPATMAIYLQTLGGIWILQTLPAVVVGLYSRWFHRVGLLLGWLVGMVVGTGMAWAEAFKTSVYPLHLGGLVIPGYAAVWALIANFAVAAVLTVIFNAMGVAKGNDSTAPADYEGTSVASV